VPVEGLEPPTHGLQNLAFVIDRPPQIAELAVDLHEHFIQMPTPLREGAQMRNPRFCRSAESPGLGSMCLKRSRRTRTIRFSSSTT
jgi:hypothetical protein